MGAKNAYTSVQPPHSLSLSFYLYPYSLFFLLPPISLHLSHIFATLCISACSIASMPLSEQDSAVSLSHSICIQSSPWHSQLHNNQKGAHISAAMLSVAATRHHNTNLKGIKRAEESSSHFLPFVVSEATRAGLMCCHWDRCTHKGPKVGLLKSPSCGLQIPSFLCLPVLVLNTRQELIPHQVRPTMASESPFPSRRGLTIQYIKGGTYERFSCRVYSLDNLRVDMCTCCVCVCGKTW